MLICRIQNEKETKSFIGYSNTIIYYVTMPYIPNSNTSFIFWYVTANNLCYNRLDFNQCIFMFSLGKKMRVCQKCKKIVSKEDYEALLGYCKDCALEVFDRLEKRTTYIKKKEMF